MKTYAYAVFAALCLFAAIVIGIVLRGGKSNQQPGPGTGVATGAGEAGSGGTSTASGSPTSRSGSGTEGASSTGASGATGSSTTGDGSEAVVRVPDAAVVPAPLPRGANSITFVLTDGGQQPMGGVVITLRTGTSADDVVTDPQGEARFAELADGVYSYIIESDGRPRLTSTAAVEVAGGEDRRLELIIPSFDLEISGRVLNKDGEPVEGIEVVALPYLFGAGEDRFVPYQQEEQKSASDADGRYVIAQLQAGEYEVRSVATDLYPTARTIVRAGVDSADLLLVKSRELVVAGIVTDSDGRPIEGVRIVPVGQSPRGSDTDASGAYALSLEHSESKQNYTFRFLKEGFQEAHRTLSSEEVGESDKVTLDAVMQSIDELTAVEGIVKTAGGEPVAGEVVHFHSQLTKARYQAVTDAGGFFSISDVQTAADYRVWIRPQGPYEDYTEKSVWISASMPRLEIELVPLASGTVSGVIVDPEGVPIPSFSIWVRSVKAQTKSQEIVSDADGRFHAEDVPDGQLIFETRSLPRFTIGGLQTGSQGTTKDVKLVIDWGAHQFQGRVLDPDGAAVAGAQVYLTWFHRDGALRSGSTRKTVTDDAGVFQFTQLGAGPHQISVNAVGYQAAQASIDVGNDPNDVELRLVSGMR